MLSRIVRGEKTPAHLVWPPAPGARPSPAGDPAPAGQNADRAAMEAQMEQRSREARQAGFREGSAAGRSEAAAALRPFMDKLAQTIQEVEGMRPRLLREAQAELVALSLGIARRILHRELAVDPEAIAGLVAAAVDKLASQEICRIRAHPELETGVREALERAGRSGIALMADPSLERGALLFDMARGRVDASLETQLAEIGRGLADRMEAN